MNDGYTLTRRVKPRQNETQIERERTETVGPTNGVTSSSRDSACASHAVSSGGVRVVGDPRVTPKEPAPGS